MSKFLRHDPCYACGSQDNNAVYEEKDGRISAYCFGCQVHIYNYEGNNDTVDQEDFDYIPTPTGGVNTYPYGTHTFRGISDSVSEMFGVRYSTAEDGSRHEIFYPYPSGGDEGDGSSQTSYKVRCIPKSFRVIGGLPPLLFGMHLFSGGNKLIITEGEEDTLAVAEASMQHYGKVFPVVSIASSSNLKSITENIKWIKGFNEVILWMDNDEAGEKAKRSIAKMIGYDKCFIAAANSNDASELAQEGKFKEINQAIWNAAKYNPQGILTSKELWQQLQDDAHIVSVPYPPIFKGLNDKTKGMRFGEISLFTSGTGAGKSSMMREIMMHVLETTEDRVGIISLEESPAETVRKLCMMQLRMNPADHELPLSELESPFKEVFGEDRVVVLDHQGAITETITDQLNYMASIGCKYLFVDHITILVSEGAEGLSGNEATDKVMNDLLKVAKTHSVWIGLVSHLRKSDKIGKSFEQGTMPSLDDIKGSGSIKQIAMDIVAFSRNSEEGENMVKLKVLKCRKTGKTGPAGSLLYDDNTGRMVAGEDIEEF